MDYDIIITGAGPGGIFALYELVKLDKNLKIAVFETGHSLENRKCPIGNGKVTSCIHCKSCSIMNGFGGAGAFSDGKYNITNQFGGTLYEYIGKEKALELMNYVDGLNLEFGGRGTKLYSTANTKIKKLCIQNGLHLLDASVRHLGTDINFIVLQNIYDLLKDKADFYFDTPVEHVVYNDGKYIVKTADRSYDCSKCIISAGRSGSKWMQQVCNELSLPVKSNRVDIGVRVELPAEVFAHLTENTNFALLVAKHFSEPFSDSNGYGESIARLSNMLGGGVLVQRFGDLVRGRRSNQSRIEEGFITPTLAATPGDLSLVMPKRILDGIIEMIYRLDRIAPGTANDDTLLYGVEVKFYNMETVIDSHLETEKKGLYVIGDCSGVTHSLSHASASGVHVAICIIEDGQI